MSCCMENNEQPRALSHDERHAAEAAFSGRPLNPRWSARARAVYEGILKSLPTPKTLEEPAEPMTSLTESTAEPVASEQVSDRGMSAQVSVQQALDSGALIDVTPTAKQVGLSCPVAMTKPLW